MTAATTRTLRCLNCQHVQLIPMEDQWKRHTYIACKKCGAELVNHSRSEAIAKAHISLERAREVMASHTYEEVQALSERAYAGGVLSAEETDVIMAYVRLRSAGEVATCA